MPYCDQDMPSHNSVQGRLVAGIVDVPGGLSLLIGSACVDVNEGMPAQNRHLLHSWAMLAMECSACTRHWLLGGDFNNLPDEVQASGVDDMLGAVVVAPTARAGTCTQGKGTRRRTKRHRGDTEAEEHARRKKRHRPKKYKNSKSPCAEQAIF